MRWESTSWLQKRFMEWFNAERLRHVIAFPVESLSLLNDGTDFIDQVWANFAAKMYSEGHSFFTYTSDSVDSLASCCYTGDTDVIVRSGSDVRLLPFREIENTNLDMDNLQTISNGRWKRARLVKLPARQIYNVTLSNGLSMKLTDNHRNNCLNGMKFTKDLTTDDYIMVSSEFLPADEGSDAHLTFAQGFAVGAFLSYGSVDCELNRLSDFSEVNMIEFKFPEEHHWKAAWITQACNDFGCEDAEISGKITLEHGETLTAVRVLSRKFAMSLLAWTNWAPGIQPEDLELNMNCILQSHDFRNGILSGWYSENNTTSYSAGRTMSKNLIGNIQAVCTSFGKIAILGADYDHEPIIYWLIHPAENRQNISAGSCVYSDNAYWFRVSSVDLVDYAGEYVYCFEMEDPADDKFTLPNGIHNYNCRLRNGIQDNQFSYTLGAGGVATGSKCVITINMNRLVQNALMDEVDAEAPAVKRHMEIADIVKDDEAFERCMGKISRSVAEQAEKIHKYLISFNDMLLEMYDKHMLSIYDAGFISPEKQYLTLGELTPLMAVMP